LLSDSLGFGVNPKKSKQTNGSRHAFAVSPSQKRWLRLKRRFPNHPAIQAESLYVLPPDLISAIDKQLPKLLNPADIEFELELAQLEDVGFFRQRSITCPILPWGGRLGVGDPSLQRRIERSSAAIDQMLRDEWSAAGCNDLQVEHIVQQRAEIRRQIKLRQQGYLGWLVTDGRFRGELNRLRHAWDQQHKRSAILPSLPLELFGQRRTRPAPEVADSEHDSIKLLWKWGLQGFGSWDLPLPLSPALTGSNLYSLTDQEAAGTVLFVPWYFLVNRDMGLEEIIDQHRLEHPQPHLQSWIRGRESKRFGVMRFALMLKLYVWIELVLRRRYAERLEGQLGRVDRAIAHYLCSDQERHRLGRIEKLAENVRRVRLQMNKRLQEIDVSSR
jgi:hypothetical protein